MKDFVNILARKRAFCPSCRRICEPGITWEGANYCRGLILLRFIKEKPGFSGWELFQASGILYTDTTDPVARAHFVGAVREVEALR
jgi:hypothetical protein